MDPYNNMQDNLEELMSQTEKELNHYNKLRAKKLGQELKDKEDLIEDYRSKLIQIQEDFQYNAKLILERDTEITHLEANLQSLKDTLIHKEKEYQLNLYHLQQSEDNLRNELKITKEAQKLATVNEDALREEMADLKWSKEEQLLYERNTHKQALRELENKVKYNEETKNQEIKQIVEKYERRMYEKDETLHKLSHLNAEIQVYKSQEQDFSRKIAEIEKLNSKEIQSLMNELSVKEEKIREISSSVNFSSEQAALTIKELEFELEISNEKNSKLETELKRIQGAHSEEIRILNHTNDLKLSRIQSTLNNQILRLQEKLSLSEDEIENSRSIVKSLREKILRLESTYTQDTNEMESMHRHQLKIADDASRKLKLEITELNSENFKLNDLVQEYSNGNDKLRREVYSLKQLQQKTESEIEMLKQEIERISREKNSKIEEVYFERIKDQETIKEIVQDRNNVQEHFEIEIEKLKEEVQNLKETVCQKDDFIAQKEGELNEHRVKYEIITSNCQRYKNEVVKLHTEREKLLEISSNLQAQLRHDESKAKTRKPLPSYEHFEDIMTPQHDE